jgi:hypothetical protein
LTFAGSDDLKSEQKELKSGDIIFSSNNLISILNLEISSGELIEKLETTGVQINSQYEVLSIEVVKLNQHNGKNCMILMSTVATLYYMYGLGDINMVFGKYKESPETRLK